MSNPNYDNCIIGGGIAGLTIFYYLSELTKTRNLLITNNLNSQTSRKFPLGPRFLHHNKDTEALLRRLRLPIKTKEIFIGYKMNDDIRNFAGNDFKKLYAIKSRGSSKIEESFLTGGKSSFTAFETSQNDLANVLLSEGVAISEKSENDNMIVVDDIKFIEHRKISMKDIKTPFYVDNIISTIPLNSLSKMLSNTSITVSISTTPEEMTFFLVNKKGKGHFDYIYSVTDCWHRKTYVPNLDKWVYETRNPLEFSSCFNDIIDDYVQIKSQITRSLNLKELGNIKLVGRYAQMNHSIKTEDVIHWAYNYTRKFKK